MSSSFQTILKISIVVILVVVFAFYGIAKTANFRAGPSIKITSPADGATAAESYLPIEGIAKNISLFYLGGRQIYTDTNGNFKEGLLLAPGYNIIELAGKDKFGREVKKTLKIMYHPAQPTQNQEQNVNQEIRSTTTESVEFFDVNESN